ELVQLKSEVSRLREKIHNTDGEEKFIVTHLISDELQELEGHVESILHNHVYENWNNVILIALNISNIATIAFDEQVSEYIHTLIGQLEAISLDETNVEQELEKA
ncbi:MAG: hypothetical protein GWN00_37325, partial [Aliifodinibius sp.]|nr:hypothetical protein [candidate division Zixibacteria bacterium]NIT61662.1 hypothetical protein [Fodinibius sp.]NIR67786.1 hypothetical protein [candidate division Zixibacteria bacterium]NIS49018.1 hypothetical protein [candidate division Zixibacteria bacterium]NIU17104.1 hypothetical protein [candidate division Zixibacteria bacterium]